MDRIRRGWALTKQSWRVLLGDRSLLIFPILSTIFALLSAAAAIWAPTMIMSGPITGEAVDQNDPVYYIATAATVYVSTFIAIFFNVALAACAVRSMRGEDTTVGDGFTAALQRIGPILGWTLVVRHHRADPAAAGGARTPGRPDRGVDRGCGLGRCVVLRRSR